MNPLRDIMQYEYTVVLFVFVCMSGNTQKGFHCFIEFIITDVQDSLLNFNAFEVH